MKIDLYHDVKPVVAIPITEIVANGTTTGSIVDSYGFEAVVFQLLSGTLTDGTYTPKLWAGNDPSLSDAVEVPANFLLGTIVDATFAATDDDTVKWLGTNYDGFRYFRLDITAASVTSGGFISAVALFGSPLTAPTVNN